MNIASIDIGTNTVLLLIAKLDFKSKTLTPLLDKIRIPRIGDGVALTGIIRDDKITDLMIILKEYLNLIESFNCQQILVKATNAFRVAKNSNEIIKRIKQELKLNIEVISGEEEARLSFLGAITGMRGEKFCVIDIGGGSTELVFGDKNNVIFRKSFEIGAVKATNLYLNGKINSEDDVDRLNKILKQIIDFKIREDWRGYETIAVAGTPTTIGSILLNHNSFKPEALDNTKITKFALADLIKTSFINSSPESILQNFPITKGREDIILAGSVILLYFMNLLKLDYVIVSIKGLRYGSVYDFLTVMDGHSG